MATIASNKRKKPPHLQTAADRKRAKTFDARTLAAQSSDAALSASGELNVAAYVSAREFEIRALERGIQQSKGVASTRAFQQVPRSLRRRTASHNVKRVPKRLRARAKREMIEDNTPTVTPRRRKPTERLRIRLETARRLQNLNTKTKTKRAISKAKRDKQTTKTLESAGSHAYNTAPRIPKIKKNKLSRPAPPDAKYKKRQRCKTWLPTHVFHAKRAHMTSPAEPLWRFAVPLSPTEKSYRPSHRARGARGAVVWDMSYVSTVQIEGTVEGVESVLRGVGVDGDEAWGRKGRKWRAGTRSLQTWVFERKSGDGDGYRPIAPVTLVWAAEEKSKEVEMVDVDDKKTKKGKRDRRKVFIRVHPSAFLQLWNELLEISKRQNPPVMVEDLRFEIGSIEITGPGAMEALIAALQPLTTDGTPATGSPEATWTSLLGVTNPSSLPQNALLAFSISDPRLHFPSQTLRPLSSDEHMQNQAMLLASWPPDQTLSTPKIFDRPSRLAAVRQLPSQKAINRRRTLAGPGIRPAGQASDPQIPVMILASPSRPTTSPATTTSNLPGSLTVLLPWKCVLPVWYSLMYYPLSSGGNPRFGGLQEQRQLAFEAGTPWFPGDHPGTRAGWEWGLREREETRREWERKPKGRRIEFDRLDLGTPGRRKRGEIGRGWACDWERLMQGPDASRPPPPPPPPENEHPEHPPLHIHQLRSDEAEAALSRARNGEEEVEADRRNSGALATVRIWLMHRGTPTPRARIYRLPSDRELSQRWLEQGQRQPQPHKAESQTLAMTPEEARQSLAAALEQPEDGHQDNELPIPGEEDLIGFVTTGAYNLAEGKGTGIGSIAVDRVGHAQQQQKSKQKPKHHKSNNSSSSSSSSQEKERMCIVRGAGERVGRLGHWEVC